MAGRQPECPVMRAPTGGCRDLGGMARAPDRAGLAAPQRKELKWGPNRSRKELANWVQREQRRGSSGRTGGAARTWE